MVCLLSKPAGIYRSRQPLESDFHRLIREHFDDFRAVYAERYARKFGFWRPVFDKAVREFLKCGDLHEGFARVRCPDCRHEFFVAFSCKQRCICPSCSQKRTVLFGVHVAEDVCLNVPHRQFVWTIPKRLRIFFRFHRSLLHRLPALAWETLLEAYRAALGADVNPGGILTIQTFGQLIHFHPHIHGLVTDGAFTSDGRFIPVPLNLSHEPFLRLWEDKVFRLLLDENKIGPDVVAQIRAWRHSGFNVDRSVRLEAGDREGIENLAQYMARSPFSLARLVRITVSGQVVYRAEKHHPQRFPEPASLDLLGGTPRNFQVFQPLDFLAELTQHIPNKGEHFIRYYGHYSNKTRGMRSRQAATGKTGSDQDQAGQRKLDREQQIIIRPSDRRIHRRWAMMIKRVYQADPLLCPHCGGTMKIIAFIDTRRQDIIRKILQHCGLWEDPPSRGPPPTAHPSQTRRQANVPDSRLTYEVDPDFLEYARWEALEQTELSWDP
jgi:hypothetical protein